MHLFIIAGAILALPQARSTSTTRTTVRATSTVAAVISPAANTAASNNVPTYAPVATPSTTVGKSAASDALPIIIPPISWTVVAIFAGVVVGIAVVTTCCLMRMDNFLTMDEYCNDALPTSRNRAQSELSIPASFYQVHRPRVDSLKDCQLENVPPQTRLDLSIVQSHNEGSSALPVLRSYQKAQDDELYLIPGDEVILHKVYQDGWALGVSRRFGGPAVFPLWHLGGPIPQLMYAESMQTKPVENGTFWRLSSWFFRSNSRPSSPQTNSAHASPKQRRRPLPTPPGE
ncbi:hypothetical protein EDD86DRAFT_217877 [Gorgonomyces haynaldii]|nr:hypothetical protein EDD86DRAFT_217877 [Gorgonomyces haynaldii]